VDGTGAVIGIVTSGTMSPSMNKGIGLGYVTVANSAVDSDIIRIRKNDVAAKVVKLPSTRNKLVFLSANPLIFITSSTVFYKSVR
jgi:glycine cleavage system aminomethyltransferase T